ncbi:NUMOD4 motif-containing HNH endonuclease [Novosphingobium sp.]|uniref:NUMOD4 motif-containing HNH endonuclease n=1 Tax=Novosphingobium sp. TaxID=1874826 RepID=UPI003565556A
MSERWKTVLGFPDYMVSSEGRVYSHISQKFLRPGIASNGYPTVALGRGNTRTLHSLVAETFIGPCPAGMEVRHRDGIRTNPKLSNLRYGSRSDNIKDAYEHGTRNGQTANPKKAVATKDQRYPGWRSAAFSGPFKKGGTTA